jgi:hypothetical protein
LSIDVVRDGETCNVWFVSLLGVLRSAHAVISDDGDGVEEALFRDEDVVSVAAALGKMRLRWAVADAFRVL